LEQEELEILVVAAVELALLQYFHQSLLLEVLKVALAAVVPA
tara:strand:+ start:315 stop:440 length:126 start_codon:yes stop_codon:yes gene_type:complete